MREMPRKKKAVQSHVPPLLFVNSPDFQSVPVLTPDLAVDNPVTARPVLVEDLTDSTWVSPQFRNCHELSKCQNSRRNHRYLGHTLAHARHRVGEIGDNECATKIKFKPLTFLNSNNSHSRVPTTSLTDVISVDINNIVVHTPNFTQQQMCSVENVNTDMCNGNSRNIELTPVRVAHGDHTEVHKLLKPNNLFPQYGFVNSEKHKQYKDPSKQLGNAQLLRELNHSEIPQGHSINKPSNVMPCLPQDNDHGLTNQLACLVARTPQAGSNNSAVLVVDTPECDYSLTFRQRQLKYR